MIPDLVSRACDPYPAPKPGQDGPGPLDCRRSIYLTKVLEGLDRGELGLLARRLGNLYPRDFEQELLWIQRARAHKR